jgi:endonuclease YncB( thermonuclease family)
MTNDRKKSNMARLTQIRVNMLRLTQIRVIDGDTIVGDVELPFAVTLHQQHVRFLGVDAWEIHGAQKPKGELARQYTLAAVAAGDVYLEPAGDGARDDFGRLLARIVIVMADGTVRDLAAELIAQGLGRPYKK